MTHKEELIVLKRDGKIGVFSKSEENQLISKAIWSINCQGFFWIELGRPEIGEFLAVISSENELLIFDLSGLP